MNTHSLDSQVLTYTPDRDHRSRTNQHRRDAKRLRTVQGAVEVVTCLGHERGRGRARFRRGHCGVLDGEQRRIRVCERNALRAGRPTRWWRASSRFPTVAARCRSSNTMGTVMATVVNASWAHNEGCIGHHACMHTRVIGTHFGTGFLLRSVGSSNPRIELEREDSVLESTMSFEAR